MADVEVKIDGPAKKTKGAKKAKPAPPPPSNRTPRKAKVQAKAAMTTVRIPRVKGSKVAKKASPKKKK